MIVDGLKLTAYFGERDRAGGHLLADELLDLYHRREISTSILLRGIEGFGHKHSLHTDRLLTMSEDLPVVAIAVDRRDRIEQLVGDVVEIRHPGLVTVETARIVESNGAISLPSDVPHEATKLTLYIGRRERRGRTPLFISVCDLLYREGLAGATVLMGVDGTAAGRRTRANLIGSNREVPLMIVSIGSSTEIERILPLLAELVDSPMITLEQVHLCKRDGELLAPPAIADGDQTEQREHHVKLMVHASESARHEGHPLHRSLIRQLRHAGIAGATTVRGIWGFHGDHAPHGDKLIQLHRHVPTVTTVIDTPERIAEAFAIVDATTHDRGLVTSEVVPIVRSGQ